MPRNLPTLCWYKPTGELLGYSRAVDILRYIPNFKSLAYTKVMDGDFRFGDQNTGIRVLREKHMEMRYLSSSVF